MEFLANYYSCKAVPLESRMRNKGLKMIWELNFIGSPGHPYHKRYSFKDVMLTMIK